MPSAMVVCLFAILGMQDLPFLPLENYEYIYFERVEGSEQLQQTDLLWGRYKVDPRFNDWERNLILELRNVDSVITARTLRLKVTAATAEEVNRYLAEIQRSKSGKAVVVSMKRNKVGKMEIFENNGYVIGYVSIMDANKSKNDDMDRKVNAKLTIETEVVKDVSVYTVRGPEFVLYSDNRELLERALKCVNGQATTYEDNERYDLFERYMADDTCKSVMIENTDEFSAARLRYYEEMDDGEGQENLRESEAGSTVYSLTVFDRDGWMTHELLYGSEDRAREMFTRREAERHRHQSTAEEIRLEGSRIITRYQPPQPKPPAKQ